MAPIRFEYSIHGFHVYIYIDYFLKCEDSESHNDQRDTLKKRQQHIPRYEAHQCSKGRSDKVGTLGDGKKKETHK